ncbi:HEL038Cp [Eremothecium sinecaudum]|uniref:protein kinase C n=1 Tax=Eremothecium sinecaudum TaxID=45286 RepID=A0A109UXE6_9SACH|nr:HEL038Cp [Eremothecium sinecaudum]AMD21242.1 HEL038Cp [Eremothecium sinecaudum]
MLSNVEQDILRKIEVERNIIQGASALKKKTDNAQVIQKCNTSIRESQQNIQYLEDTLGRLQMSETRQHASSTAHPGYGQLTTISPNEHRFSRLELAKFDCPSICQRNQYMLQLLEFKLSIERQYQAANDKLTKLYQIDGDQRSSSAAQGGAYKSKQRIQLLTKALKKYQAINVDIDGYRDHGDDSSNGQHKFRRKQLTGDLTIGISSISDVDHIQSPLFSKKPETVITIKVDDVMKGSTKPSKTDRWHDEFHIHVEKGNEVEITVYDRINDRVVPVAVLWLLLSDIAEEIRKKKIGQTGSAWYDVGDVLPDSDPYGDTSAAHLAIDALNYRTRVKSSAETTNDHSTPVTSNAWFVLEPAGQILLTLGFNKSTQDQRKDLKGLRRHGAIVNRKDDIYEKHGHHFVQKSFYNIMCCAYCGDFLRYTGFQCQDCKFLCHKKCYGNIVTKCIAKTSTEVDPDETKLNHRIPHRFEPTSNRGTKWCCHCGYILPWGKKSVRKCTECSVMCHAQCAHLVPDFCGMSMEMAAKVLTTIKNTNLGHQQKRTSSPTPIQVSEPQGDDYDEFPERIESKTSESVPEKSAYMQVVNPDPLNRHAYDSHVVQDMPQVKDQESPTIALNSDEKMHDTIEKQVDYNNAADEAYLKFTNASISQKNSANDLRSTLDPGPPVSSNYNADVREYAAYVRDKVIRDEDFASTEDNRSEISRQHQLPEPIDPAMLNLKQNPFNVECMTEEPTSLIATNEFDNLAASLDAKAATALEAFEASQGIVEKPAQDTRISPVQTTPQQRVRPASNRQKRKTPKRRKVTLDDFVLLKVLGKGNFGKVLLARSKNTDRLCAIKVLKKDHIIQNHDIESARAEKKVFLLATKAKHPFLTNLYCSFQTENRIYFAMEFVGGGDLMWHVQNKRLSVRRAKFYAAEVLLALKYFHDNGIIYRDLKLENILLTLEGHIKIADYGLCKDNMWDGHRTATFCGTPEFMAPEILKEEAYTKAVDWWAFGVLLYQMLLCQSPFSGDDEDEVFNAILTDEPLYPIDMAGDIVQIFQGLLTKDPEKRLGRGVRDALEVMEEPFFSNINFDDVYHLRVEPPYIPKLKAADDTSYFEKEFTTAPPNLTPLPSILSASLQEEFRGFSFMPDDLVL